MNDDRRREDEPNPIVPPAPAVMPVPAAPNEMRVHAAHLRMALSVYTKLRAEDETKRGYLLPSAHLSGLRDLLKYIDGGATVLHIIPERG